MKKIFVLILSIFSLVILTSCVGETEYNVIIKNGDIIEGYDELVSFYERACLGKPCSITLTKTYTLEEGGYSKEYYEENKDKYPHTHINKVVYDGKRFKTYYNSVFQESFKYIKYEKSNGNASSAYNYVERYYLVDDLNIDFAAYQRALFSSVKVDIPSFYSISNVYNYKNIHFIDSEMLDINHSGLNTPYTKIEVNEYKASISFRFLDYLDWQKESPFGDYHMEKDRIYLSADRTLYSDNLNLVSSPIGSKIALVYILDLKNGVAIMDKAAVSSTLHMRYARIDSFETCKLLEELGIDINFGTYGVLGTYTCENEYFTFFSNGTFAKGNIYMSSYEYVGKYYVIGNKVFGVDSMKAVNGYFGKKFEFEIKDNTLVSNKKIYTLLIK